MPDDPAPQADQSKHRSQRMKLAVKTSLISKASTAIVTLLALPIAKKALGDDTFVLYAVLVTSLLWSRVFASGIGPALTLKVAEAAVSEDREKESRLSTSALLPITIIAIVFFIAALVYASVGSMDLLVGGKITYSNSDARMGVAILGGLFSVQIIGACFEAMQAGYQETHYINVRQTAANIVTLGAVLAVAKWGPTATNLILAQSLPFVLAQLVNAALLVRTRPHLFPRLSKFDRGYCRELVVDGMAYVISGGFSSYLTLQFPVTFASRFLAPAQSSLVVLSLSLVTQLFGMVSMIIVPLRPALADAQARGEYAWIRRAFRKALLFTSAYGLGVGLFIFGLGGWIFFRIMHSTFVPDLVFCALWALNFFLYCWENLHFNVLFGTRYRFAAAGLWLGRCIVAYLIMRPLLDTMQASGVYAAMAASIILVSAVPYFVLMKRVLHPASESAS